VPQLMVKISSGVYAWRCAEKCRRKKKSVKEVMIAMVCGERRIIEVNLRILINNVRLVLKGSREKRTCSVFVSEMSLT